ncbi:MAG: hypothetical protein RLZZ352_172 [Pseudomonadota bacterium]|jgi:uncharacterized protein
MNPNPNMQWNPERLDVRAFAQTGARLEAREALSRFERLQDEVAPEHATQMPNIDVAWQAHGEIRPGADGRQADIWLHLVAHTELPLTCQRCLMPCNTPLTVDRWLRFVADEAAAEAEDEACEEDVLALEPKPSLRLLIEDELLMSLPLIPMHDTCPSPSVLPAAEAQGAVAEPPKHPFAVLAHLKK